MCAPASAPEITTPVRQCLPDGRLDPRAVGWARGPLVDSNLPALSWGRRKRWHHWCVVSGDHILAVTLADIDYLGLAVALFIDLATGQEIEVASALPLGLGVRLPDAVWGRARGRGLGLTIGIDAQPGLVTIQARSRRLEADIHLDWPASHETLGIVVPWSPTRHQHTVKANALPARGRVRARGRDIAFDGFGCLDYGRGLWPYRTTWNWASASGLSAAGHTIGFNLGARWTDGTGVNENALTVDSRLTKVGDVRFDYDSRDFMQPWRIAGADGAVALQFTPRHHKRVRVPLGLASSALDLCFGRFDGQLIDEHGRTHVISNFTGWAEQHHARW